jgi:hypothetical protein
MIVAPTHEPSVPASTMPGRERLPVAWARWAAKRDDNSLGIGMKVLSMAINAAIKGYPRNRAYSDTIESGERALLSFVCWW